MDIECLHVREKLVYTVASNGTKMYANQCRQCGRKSPWIKKSLLPKDLHEAIPEEDKTIADDFNRDRRDAFAQAGEEKRKQDRAEFFRVYNEYLNSAEWDRKRRRRLSLNEQLFSGYCEICLDNKATQCHHTTYNRIFKEWQFDLACICKECHDQIHHDHKERGNNGRP